MRKLISPKTLSRDTLQVSAVSLSLVIGPTKEEQQQPEYIEDFREGLDHHTQNLVPPSSAIIDFYHFNSELV